MRDDDEADHGEGGRGDGGPGDPVQAGSDNLAHRSSQEAQKVQTHSA